MDIWGNMRACFVSLFLFAVVIFCQAGLIENITGPLSIYTTPVGTNGYYDRNWEIKYSATYYDFGTNALPEVTIYTAFPDKHVHITANGSGSVWYNNSPGQASPDGSAMFHTNGFEGYNCYLIIDQKHPTVTSTSDQGAHGAGNDQGVNLKTVTTPIDIYYTTNNPPPNTNYYCYFSLEGVANFEGITNINVLALLYVGPTVIVGGNLYQEQYQYDFHIFVDGAFDLQMGPYFLSTEVGGGTPHQYAWAVDDSINPTWYSGIQWTATENPNYYDYVVNHDCIIHGTNAPYIPEIPPSPTNMPPQYPEMPSEWNTNVYGPYPPYYSPWPPPYPPPPPLTSWPVYPPPNWTYNTNSPYSPDAPPTPTPDPYNPTNYPDPDPGGTNGTYTLSQWYSAFRDVLRDSGNEVNFAVPAQYQLVWSNTISPAVDQANQFIQAGGQVVSNLHNVAALGVQRIGELSVSLPSSFESKTEINLGELPIFGATVINLANYSTPINLFRNICKYGLYLTSVLLAMHMIRKTLSRGGD